MGGSEVITWDEKSNEFSYKHNFFKQKPDWNIADFIQQPGTHKYWISINMVVWLSMTGQEEY